MLDLFKPQNVRALEVRYDLVPYTKGTVLDLGCGPWKTYPHFIGVDLCEDWPKHIPWRPDIVADCRELNIFAGQSVDAVFSSFLLNEWEEKEQADALREWWRVIKPGGHLILYFPCDGKTTPEKYMKDAKGGWDCVVKEQKPEFNTELQVYQKRSDGAHHYSCVKPKPEKTCAVVRFGGIGDLIQTSSILPELKKQGYHVTLYVSHGYEIIKDDPYVDRFIVQQTEQVPNGELGEYFTYLRSKYDKFVNLCESVEGTLLAMPGRTLYQWPQDARNKLMNFNYLEVMHDLAEVPFEIHTRFYPTLAEKVWALKERKRFPGKVILWVLSGSSVHKAWPYMDQIIARLLIQYPDVTVILSGDELSQMLEAGWQEEPRVIRTSGKWSVRETLTFAHHADLVIGPETGVLNAVSMLDVPKIIYLSHSSVENLTRDWVNTVSLIPKDCPCAPCHILHYGFEKCPRDEKTGVAVCQANIDVEDMWNAIRGKI